MIRVVALLRAVNVGGTGKMPMADLKDICEGLGFENVWTYIASGNVVFDTETDAVGAQAALSGKVDEYAGKTVGLFIVTASQLDQILAENPFADKAGNASTVLFLGRKTKAYDIKGLRGQTDEIVRLGPQVIYCHYPSGMGCSKLKMGAADYGTVRNMNTVAKLTDMVRQSL